MDEGRIELPASSLRTKHSTIELLARVDSKLDYSIIVWSGRDLNPRLVGFSFC